MALRCVGASLVAAPIKRDSRECGSLRSLRTCLRRESCYSASRKRKLPEHYARDFMRRAKRHWFADSIW